MRKGWFRLLSPFVNNKFCLKADESKTLDFGKIEVRSTGIDLLYRQKIIPKTPRCLVS